MILEEEFPDTDIQKTIEILLVHDLCEAYDGDVPAIFEQPKNKYELEEKAMKRIVKPLSKKLRKKIFRLWKEFEACKTKEAKLAKALDKLEVLVQHNEANISTWIDKEYTLNITHGRKFMNFHPFIKALRKEIDKWTKKKIRKEGRKKWF